jgi:signal transduction histidine kinase
MSRTSSATLRTEVRRAITVVSVVVVLLFGVPLAIVVNRLVQGSALVVLQRDATRAVATVPDNVIEAGVVLHPPRSSPGTSIGVYDALGNLVAGRGPRHSPLAARAVDGREHDGTDRGDLSVVVPVLSDTTVAGSVRSAVPTGTLRGRTLRAWGLIGLLAVAVVGVGRLLAGRAAGRISAPFEMLTGAARELAAGRYRLSLPHWGIVEADRASDALRDSGLAVEELLQHERDFVTHASHQLRTPLAGLVLALDRPRPDVDTALERAHHLELTIADLIALRGLASTGSCRPYAVATDAVRRWSCQGRGIAVRGDDDLEVALAAPAMRQALDVLMHNAVRHGAGDVLVTVESLGDQVLVEVADHGPGFADGAERGTGLRLAAGIAERAGGSLLVRRRAPQPRVALLLPSSSTSNR